MAPEHRRIFNFIRRWTMEEDRRLERLDEMLVAREQALWQDGSGETRLAAGVAGAG